MPTDRPAAPSSTARGHASILDVARLAGVSISTVSRSLRGLPNVSQPTRQRVLDAAAELSYVASPGASGLASGQTRAIGVVVPFVTRWFFANAVAGAYDALSEAGYDVLLYHLGSADARDRFFDRMPLARRVDAVLALTMPLSDDHTLALRALDMPLVTVGARVDGVSSVRIDDVAAAQSAVNHLIHQGHESIAMLSSLMDDPRLEFSSSRDRRMGFQLAMAAAGMQPEDDLVVAGMHGVDGGAEAMSQLLSGERLPTAVFAEYDELAIGAVRTLRRAGFEVPEQLSVVGIDNHEMSSVVDLTTVAQPVHELGNVAARLLLDTLADRLQSAAEVILPTRLMVRGSTAPPSARGR